MKINILFRLSIFNFVILTCTIDAKGINSSAINNTHKQSQTEAYLAIPENALGLENCFKDGQGQCNMRGFNLKFKDIFKIKPDLHNIVSQILEQEKKYKDTHFVFYHGQSKYWILFNDFHKTMYELQNKKSVTDNFIFLRNPDNKFFNLPSLENWMKSNENRESDYPAFDLRYDIKEYLLSVNLSLFGTSYWSMSNSFVYFLSSFSMSGDYLYTPLDTAIQKYNKDYNKRTIYINKILKLERYLAKYETGNLIQIFIRHEDVNDLVYLSKNYGRFWKDNLNIDGYNNNKGYYTQISPLLYLFKNKKEILNKPYLDAPNDIRQTILIDAFQGRILLRGEYFGSPELAKEKNIVMNSYILDQSEIKKEYLAELKKICIEIFENSDK